MWAGARSLMFLTFLSRRRSSCSEPAWRHWSRVAAIARSPASALPPPAPARPRDVWHLARRRVFFLVRISARRPEVAALSDFYAQIEANCLRGFAVLPVDPAEKLDQPLLK